MSRTQKRAERIKEAALSGLQEYFACLHDATFVAEVKSTLIVPDTGNDQLDYENVRDQVEKAANAAESRYVERQRSGQPTKPRRTTMTRPEAIKLALNVLRPFAEAGNIYDDYKADEGFSDDQYEAMLAVLHADDPGSKEGPWSVFYEAEGNVYRIGPFDNQEVAELAATKAQAEGEFDIHDQQVYLVGPDHRMFMLTEDDVGASP